MTKPEYHTQSIEIVLNKDSALWAKIVARAAESGMTVDELIETLLLAGLYHELERKLK